MENATKEFIKYEKEEEEKSNKKEERWRRETEMEEKRQQDLREHEMRMMQMVTNMFQQSLPYTGPRVDFEEY